MNNVNKQGQVTVFYPVTPGVGGKYTATNVASVYKERNEDKKVALVDFDFKAPFLAGYLSDNDKIHGVDNLIDKIAGQILDEELFSENMVVLSNGVELLKGTKLGINHHFIEKVHIEEIVRFLRKMYDAVFVSVSNLPDNSATPNMLLIADEIVVVSKNDFTSYSTIESSLKTVKHYKSENVNLKFVYNQYNEGSNLDFNTMINEHDLKVIGVIPYSPETIDNKDLKGKALNIFNRKRSETPFDEVVESLEI